MKSFMKTPLLMVLLMAVFSFGFSSANAKTPTKDKTITKANKVTNIKRAPLRCQMQSFLEINLGSQTLLGNLKNRECEAKTIERDDGSIVVISSDCKIAIIPAPSAA